MSRGIATLVLGVTQKRCHKQENKQIKTTEICHKQALALTRSFLTAQCSLLIGKLDLDLVAVRFGDW